MTRLLFVLVGFVLAAPAFADDIQRNYHETFDVKKGDRLRLDHGDGDVELSVWDQDVVDVKIEYDATVKGIGVGTPPDFEAYFERKGNTIFVRGREKGAGVSFVYTSINVRRYRYTIQAPAWVELEIYGEDGDVDVRGFHSEITCEIEDGDVTLSDCEGSRGIIELADGDLRLIRCKGSFEIENEDGDVTLRSHASGPLRVRTQDGDIEMDIVKAGEIDLEVRSADGNVRIELEPGIAAEFEIDTDDGWVDVDLPDAKTRDRRHGFISGTTGGKGESGSIRIRTADGNVELREA